MEYDTNSPSFQKITIYLNQVLVETLGLINDHQPYQAIKLFSTDVAALIPTSQKYDGSFFTGEHRFLAKNVFNRLFPLWHDLSDDEVSHLTGSSDKITPETFQKKITYLHALISRLPFISS